MGKLFGLLQLVNGVVDSVEALAGAGNGATKKTAALAILKLALPFIEGRTGRDLVDDALVESTVGKLIDAIVATKNLVGDFQSKKPV